jgi:hypothetical protein
MTRLTMMMMMSEPATIVSAEDKLSLDRGSFGSRANRRSALNNA